MRENSTSVNPAVDSEMQEIVASAAVVEPTTVVSVPQQTSASKKLITERITGYKLVKRSSDNSEVFIVTTAGSKQIWVPKSQFDINAESITFSPVKKGDTWTNPKTGATGVYQNDAYQFNTLTIKRDIDTEKEVRIDTLLALQKAGFNFDGVRL